MGSRNPYSNAEPDFEEGDVFRLIVHMRPAGVAVTSDKKSVEVTEKVTEKVTDVTEKVTEVTENRIIELLKDNSEYKTVAVFRIFKYLIQNKQSGQHNDLVRLST